LNAQADMRVSISNTVPCFEKLISKKRKVKSHWTQNISARFWKSTFWLYYFVHISSKWSFFVEHIQMLICVILSCYKF